jgi:type III secretory pathway component EscS
MKMNDQKYIDLLTQIYSDKYGILSFKDFLEINQYKLNNQYNFLNINNIISKYNLIYFNESKFENKEYFLNLFLQYTYFNNINQENFFINLYAYYISIHNSPDKIIFDLLNSKLYSVELIEIANIFANKKFINLLFNSLKILHKPSVKVDVSNSYYSDKNINIVNKYSEIFNKNDGDYNSFESSFIELSSYFKIVNISSTPKIDDSESNDKFHSKNNTTIEIGLLEFLFGEDHSNELKENINKVLEMFTKDNIFNPDLQFLKNINNKYTNYLKQMQNSADKCRIIKTILFIYSYLDKNNNNFYPSQRMYNISNTDTRWATGTEETYDSSFYGKSEFAKVFSVYYSFINGERNPYYQIINNNKYDYMDEESLKMHKYFRENINSKILFDILYNKEIIGGKSIYDVISNISEILDILESPIIYSGSSILSEIIGMVTSMLNSIAQVLDFSLSFAVKNLFYVKFLLIGEYNYSLSDIYNYLIFLKLILEKAQGENIISNISREQFVSYAYQTLGIRENDIKKIGYCAYDYEMNDLSGLNLYNDKLSKNNYQEPFNARNDLSIFYSMLQFGIMKQVYLSGNENIYNNFDFSNISNIRSIINNLTSVEKYYIFKIHYVNFEKMKNYNFNIIDDVYSIEKNIRRIDGVFNLKNVSFYKEFVELINFSSENNIKLEDEIEYNYFISNIKYKNYLNTSIKEYETKMKENKKNIDKLIFEVNNISNFDDFIMRFLPSILEVLKLLNIEHNSINSIIKFLDLACYFISDLLFRNLFIKIKFELLDQIKQIEKNMFNEFSDNKYIFNLNILGDSINKRLKNILNEIDDLVLNGGELKDCFKDIYTFIDDEEYYKYIDGEYKEEININYYDKNGSLISSESINENKKIENINIADISNVINSSNNKKLIYENKEIYIEDGDGNRIKIVYKQDKNEPSLIVRTENNNISIIKNENDSINNSNNIINDNIVSKPIITENEYDTLIQIRDFINNIQNNEIVNIVNKMNKIQKEIEQEQTKKMPNNNVIKNLNEIYSKLTEELDYAKTKNNVYVSNSSILNKNINNEFTGSDYKSITISNNYEGFSTAIEKKELLEEIENVVYENNMPLTNYEIIQLLK